MKNITYLFFFSKDVKVHLFKTKLNPKLRAQVTKPYLIGIPFYFQITISKLTILNKFYVTTKVYFFDMIQLRKFLLFSTFHILRALFIHMETGSVPGEKITWKRHLNTSCNFAIDESPAGSRSRQKQYHITDFPHSHIPTLGGKCPTETSA